MSDDLEKRTFKPGQVIFTEGEEGEEAFMVESGKVEIAKKQGAAELVLTTIDVGEMIGEMALVDPAPRSATARAMKPTTVIVIPKRVFDRLLKQTNPVVRSVLNTTLRRLRQETSKSAKGVL